MALIAPYLLVLVIFTHNSHETLKFHEEDYMTCEKQGAAIVTFLTKNKIRFNAYCRRDFSVEVSK